jgi:ubiquinone/menaquinone biosynthesis C-methylase UbiE
LNFVILLDGDELALIGEKLKDRSGGYILDVATTDGDYIQTLIKYLKEFQYAVGIDISDKDFNEGKKNFPAAKIAFLEMDSASLAFDSSAFDIVSINAGIHHVANIMMTLSEMKRVLKPGGTFIVREMYRDNLNEKQITDMMQHHWQSKIDRLLGIPHNPTLKRKQILNFIERLDLSSYDYEDFICTECDPEKDGKTENVEKSMLEQLSQIEKHESHNHLKREAEIISKRIKSVGFACATMLEIVGIK